MTRPVQPEQLYTLLATPELHDPVLIVHFQGWIDAGGCAALAIANVLDQIHPLPVASFDTEWLVDHRARRPTMHIVDSVNTGLDWPEIDLVAGTDNAGTDVLVLSGAEPDHNWRSFVDAVVGLAQQFGVRRMVGFGAYPAATPHTRPSRLSTTAATPTLTTLGMSDATLDVPAGVESALELALHKAGIEAVGLWAQVPHYVSGAAYPAASYALVDGLGAAAGLVLDSADLRAEALATRAHLDSLVSDDNSHADMLRQLEDQYDQLIDVTSELPSSDELADQVEAFLRSQNDGSEE